MFKVKADDDSLNLDPVKELNIWEKICTYTLGFICLAVIVFMFACFVKVLIPCNYILEDDAQPSISATVENSSNN